jgi:hypothetical protein
MSALTATVAAGPVATAMRPFDVGM